MHLDALSDNIDAKKVKVHLTATHGTVHSAPCLAHCAQRTATHRTINSCLGLQASCTIPFHFTQFDCTKNIVTAAKSGAWGSWFYFYVYRSVFVFFCRFSDNDHFRFAILLIRSMIIKSSNENEKFTVSRCMWRKYFGNREVKKFRKIKIQNESPNKKPEV